MTLEVAGDRAHRLLQKDLQVHPGVEHVDTVDADSSPSGHRETTLLVELSETPRGVPGWVLGRLDAYGLQLVPAVVVEGGQARLVVR